jgi:hypothetical protein
MVAHDDRYAKSARTVCNSVVSQFRRPILVDFLLPVEMMRDRSHPFVDADPARWVADFVNRFLKVTFVVPPPPPPRTCREWSFVLLMLCLTRMRTNVYFADCVLFIS